MPDPIPPVTAPPAPPGPPPCPTDITDALKAFGASALTAVDAKKDAKARFTTVLNAFSAWETGAMPAPLKVVLARHMSTLRKGLKGATIDAAPWVQFLADLSTAAAVISPQLVTLIADIQAIVVSL